MSRSELYRPSDRRLPAKLVLIFVDRRCKVCKFIDCEYCDCSVAHFDIQEVQEVANGIGKLET
jgi:hypothetical protein